MALPIRQDALSGMFELAPVSLWVEDFSALRSLLTMLRAQGITDFATFLRVHPEFIDRCMQEIRVLDVNQQTLNMVGATDKAHLLRNLQSVFRDDMRVHFADQLIDLWSDKLSQQREIINYNLNGQPINAHMQFAVMPGHEHDWAMVLVSLTDITARKMAEAYFEYLGNQNVLNGLKTVNDDLGHAAGDILLRRAGEVLGKSVDKPQYTARVGGDEFSLSNPATAMSRAICNPAWRTARTSPMSNRPLLAISASGRSYFSLLPLLRAGLPQSFRVLPVIAITSRASSGSGRPLATASAMMPMLMMTTTTMP